MKKLRDIDDKLIYALNIALPTSSIKSRTESDPTKTCADLHKKIIESHLSRGKFLSTCVQRTAEDIKKMKQSVSETSNADEERKLMTLQRKLRVLQTEEGVEQIVVEKSLRNFNERCRDYYGSI